MSTSVDHRCVACRARALSGLSADLKTDLPRYLHEHSQAIVLLRVLALPHTFSCSSYTALGITIIRTYMLFGLC